MSEIDEADKMFRHKRTSPRKVTNIPLPGNSGAMPTGAMKFENDWPGLFLRGDTAIPMAVAIRYLQKALADNPDPTIHVALHRLDEIAKIVEEDVILG